MPSPPKLLLIQPQVGMSGAFVLHAPLGILYASAEAVKRGYTVKLLDLRLSEDWRAAVRQALESEIVLVGLSVMSGHPVRHALEISDYLKKIAPKKRIVWGGPFATFHPEYILRDAPACDYVISGYGSLPLAELLGAVDDGIEPEGIPGLLKRDGKSTPADWSCHEVIRWRDIPYHLLPDYSVYGQLGQENKIFSMYSAMGCAYQCAFCSSPPLYNRIQGKRWLALPVKDTVDHIEYVMATYGADYIYFIDDDSFVNLAHVREILHEIHSRGLKLTLSFRGARINELKRMDDAYLEALSQAGTDMLHVGAESASDRLLSLVRKDCTVDDILEVNRKLARQSGIRVFYNFIVGLPTETLDDLKAIGHLWLKLLKEHPRCIIGVPNLFRPLPGTELFALAQKLYGYEPPANLLAFADSEVESISFALPWMDAPSRKYAEMLRVTSYFVDDKFNKLAGKKTLRSRIFGLLFRAYVPVARFRLRHECTAFFIEGWLYSLASLLLRKKPDILG